MRVRVRVVHYLVSRVGKRLDGIGVFIHPRPYDEKGRFHAVFREYVDKLARLLVSPRGVETYRDLLIAALDAVYRQFLLRGSRLHRREAAQQSARNKRHGRGRGDRGGFYLKRFNKHTLTSKKSSATIYAAEDSFIRYCAYLPL